MALNRKMHNLTAIVILGLGLTAFFLPMVVGAHHKGELVMMIGIVLASIGTWSLFTKRKPRS